MSTFDLTTKRGIVICRGIGCIQISDQLGNVIELDYDEVSEVGSRIALARIPNADEERFQLQRAAQGKNEHLSTTGEKQ